MNLQQIREALPGDWVDAPDPLDPALRMKLRLGPDLALLIRVRSTEDIERAARRDVLAGRPVSSPMIGVGIETCAYDSFQAVPDIPALLRWAPGAIVRTVLMGVEVTFLPPWLRESVVAELDRSLAHVAATRDVLKEPTQ